MKVVLLGQTDEMDDEPDGGGGEGGENTEMKMAKDKIRLERL